MKTLQRTAFTRCSFVTLLLFGAVACDDRTIISPDTQGEPQELVTRLSVTADLVTLKTGESTEIRLTGPAGADGHEVWSTDDSSIAEVDESGMILARNVGTTTVTVSNAGKVTDVIVTVLPARHVQHRCRTLR